MMTLSVLVFELDSYRLGLPLAAVERVEHACEVTPLPGAPAAVPGVINLQGRIAAVVDLRRRLGLVPRPVVPSDAFIVLQLPQHLFALPADEVEGVQEVDLKHLVPADTLVGGLAKVQGVVKTAQGLLLIEDPQQFLDVHDMRALDDALDAQTDRGST
ncbi:chemotaxis protein CheW [Frateuria terrea]|uniref:CheW protein n=1 Tax=Frateuria terrea TaxID=529704 RepID=A0A1H6UKR9_9GAMM|nr:chemotaxis protein CheW [Frateuria terrea]SEI88715.1 CheW protein [Frateuria terrea]SFP37548.1 purine-binding chemotaxis protein CheW [Frateuria terrea]